MSKYFEVYNYPSNLKAKLATYQLTGKASLWWEENKVINIIRGKNMIWKLFKKEFKKMYLIKRYYDEKTGEFHELRLCQLTMDEFVNKFMSLLWYVPYLNKEKATIQRFISCLPFSYKERIGFDNSKTLDKIIRKENLCYTQNKHKSDSSKNWLAKNNEKCSAKKKGFKKPTFSNTSKSV